VARTLPLLLVICLKGERIPSIAEELATDLSTVRSRIAGSRRYWFAVESFAFMNEL